jgi:hypothetical protein
VTINPDDKESFENIFKGLACSCIGVVTEEAGDLIVNYSESKGKEKNIISISVGELKAAWKKPFKGLI